MPETPFHMTIMGRRFYEHDVPQLVRSFERIEGLPAPESQREHEESEHQDDL